MKIAPKPNNELDRLKALYSLKILDNQSEKIYDRVARVARNLFNMPMSTACFIDENEVWFKPTNEINPKSIDRDTSICGHTICRAVDIDDDNSRVYEINDLKEDQRFHDNPLVVNSPNIRYYCAYILKPDLIHNIGTFCIMDTKPRTLSDKDKALFIDLGKMIEENIEVLNTAGKFSFNDLAVASDVAYKIFDEIDELLKRKSISLTDWKVLDTVIHSDFATPSFISQRLGLACSQVSKILEMLEAKGLIQRVRDIKKDDRRLVKLECKDEGREIWSYGKRVSNQVLDKLYS